MKLIQTTFFSGISTVVRIISGFVVAKVVAIFIGPSGMAVIGQLQNFINMIMLSAGNFLKTAITKYTAEYDNKVEQKHSIWSTSVKLVIILSFLLFIPLFFFSSNLSQYLLKTADYSFVFRIFAFSLPFFVFNTILLSILNGQRQIKKYVTLQIILSITSLIIVVALSVFFKLSGALIAYVINQSIVFIITFFYLRKEPWLKLRNFSKKIVKSDLNKIVGFATITFVAIISSNLSIIYVRDFIAEEVSLKDAGYWQGIWSLSQISLSLVTVSLTTYYLPTLSSLSVKSLITDELKKSIVIIFPIMLLIALTTYLLRHFIIILLYTDDFMPMEDLFFWQMFGNVIKVCGWLFGYVLVAKAMVKYTVISEVILAVTFVVFSMVLVRRSGVVGVTYAYFINAILHLVMMLYIYIFRFKDFEESSYNNSNI